MRSSERDPRLDLGKVALSWRPRCVLQGRQRCPQRRVDQFCNALVSHGLLERGDLVLARGGVLDEDKLLRDLEGHVGVRHRLRAVPDGRRQLLDHVGLEGRPALVD